MTFDNIDNEKLRAVCNDVYGVCQSEQTDRFEELFKMHKDVFNTSDVEFYSSPGRIEIVGNHTDHNGGKVLCAAINVDTLASVSKRSDGIIEVKSKGYPMLRVDVSKPDFSVSEIGTSTALIKGVVDYFKRSNKNVGGFSACMTSSVPSRVRDFLHRRLTRCLSERYSTIFITTARFLPLRLQKLPSMPRINISASRADLWTKARLRSAA